MGLDMRLTKETYVWHDERATLKITGLRSEIKPSRVFSIIEEVGVWRKANAIHKWFVDNVQEGVDDCGEYVVGGERLVELLDTVNKVIEASELIEGDVINGHRFVEGKAEPIMEKGRIIKDPSVAKRLLPTEEGFFFGGTDYDEYYYRDLIYTKKILEEALKETDVLDYKYSSSW